MANQTTPLQRREFYRRHLQGETYEEIASSAGVSKECVRYWCRRQRDGGSCQTDYQRGSCGLLSRFHPKVRYGVLRLRLEHPRWGPDRIRRQLEKRPSTRYLPLPSPASIGRYLHQWPRFRRQPKPKATSKRPNAPTQVHQRWQLDFKIGIPLNDGTLVNLHTVRDPFGEACIGAFIFPAGEVGSRAHNITWIQARSVLRMCFARWHTLPDEVQTDGEGALIGRPQDSFPSPFTLWLKGLDIVHLVIRPGRPTDNAEVERAHRTVTEYSVIGNEDAAVPQLQALLDEGIYELTFELPSQAKGCAGRPPIVAHPELLQPRRPYQPDHELLLFDLKRVDAYLATFTWERRVSKTGQITMGGQSQRYSVGRAYAGHQVLIRFDPADRHFVFYDIQKPQEEIGRRPARGLDVTDLTGFEMWPAGPGPQQLPLPFLPAKG